MNQVRLGLVGATGRMGTAVSRLVDGDYNDNASIELVVRRDGSGLDRLGDVDAVIDFSLPAGTGALAGRMEALTGRLPVLVCGTTGLDEATESRLAALGERTAVLRAGNFAPGVAAMTAALTYVAPMLGSLGYTPVITETHHRHKRDAPSGTALALLDALSPDDPDSVDIHSIRAGEIVGEHAVAFYGPSDRITLSHQALDRDLFARGALDAALWLAGRDEPRGLYTMASYFRARFFPEQPRETGA